MSPAFGVISPHPPIFVPQVGGERAEGARDSLDALERARQALEAYDPQTLVVMSPHAPAFSDAFCVDDSEVFSGSLSQFGDPTAREYDGDAELAQAVAHGIAAAGSPVALRSEDGRMRAGWLDHASIVPLAFLDPGARRRIVVLSLSDLPYESHRSLGRAVHDAAIALGRKVVFVASGDMSHRLTRDAAAGFSPRAAELDAAIAERVRQGRFGDLIHLDRDLVEAGGECGLRSVISLGGFCGDDPVPARVLAYEGPWGVGYLTALAGQAAIDADSALSTVPAASEAPEYAGETARAETAAAGRKGGIAGQPEAEIVSLARSTIEHVVNDGTEPRSPVLTDSGYPDRAGVFVSLHRGGELRGCIGTILPTRDTLAEEVAHNAVEAALHDPRFPALNVNELADLDIKVDVLRNPESCEFEDLDPKTYGVVVTSGWRRGLLLPDLPGVDDAETQVLIALQKAGIGSGEPCSLERFKVDRYT